MHHSSTSQVYPAEFSGLPTLSYRTAFNGEPEDVSRRLAPAKDDNAAGMWIEERSQDPKAICVIPI